MDFINFHFTLKENYLFTTLYHPWLLSAKMSVKKSLQQRDGQNVMVGKVRCRVNGKTQGADGIEAMLYEMKAISDRHDSYLRLHASVSVMRFVSCLSIIQ